MACMGSIMLETFRMKAAVFWHRGHSACLGDIRGCHVYAGIGHYTETRLSALVEESVSVHRGAAGHLSWTKRGHL